MPSNAAAATVFKPSDLDCHDVAASNTSEDRCELDHMTEERRAGSTPARRVGRPGRKRRQPQVASCEEAKDSMVGSRSHLCLEGQSAEQVHNGELASHQGGAAATSRQDKSSPENSTCHSEGLLDQGSSRRGRPDSSLENGVRSLPDDEEHDVEKDREQVPPTPRKKKRGRRKLEHPEKHVEEREEDSSEVGQTERGDRARLRGAVGWEISLRQNPMQRITFQAGDPYYVSKRKRDEWLAKWKMECHLSEEASG